MRKNLLLLIIAVLLSMASIYAQGRTLDPCEEERNAVNDAKYTLDYVYAPNVRNAIEPAVNGIEAEVWGAFRGYFGKPYVPPTTLIDSVKGIRWALEAMWGDFNPYPFNNEELQILYDNCGIYLNGYEDLQEKEIALAECEDPCYHERKAAKDAEYAIDYVYASDVRNAIEPALNDPKKISIAYWDQFNTYPRPENSLLDSVNSHILTIEHWVSNLPDHPNESNLLILKELCIVYLSGVEDLQNKERALKECEDENGMSIHEIGNGLGSVTVYPNPTSGELRIESGKWKIKSVAIFDLYGRMQNVKFSIENRLDISHLPAGIYFVRISTEAGEVIKKVFKE